MSTNDLRGKVAARRQQAGNGNGEGNGGEVAKRQDAVRDLLESMSGEFAAALPRMIPIDHFMRVALTGLKTTAGLAECSRGSLLAALLKCAAAGLLPCTEQAAIIPFKGEATFMPQYQGYIEIFHRTGQVARVELDWIYEADRWEYVKGDNPCFRHWPNYEADDRGEPKFAYAFLRYKDGTRSDVMILNRKQAERVRGRSKAYIGAESNRKQNSTWHTDFDAMWLKSAIRRLSKFVPKSPELRNLLAADEPDDLDGNVVPAAYGPSTIQATVIGEDAGLQGLPDGPGGDPATDSERALPGDRPPARAASGQVGIIQGHWQRLGYEDHEADEVLAETARIAGLETLGSVRELTQEQASTVASTLARFKTRPSLVAWLHPEPADPGPADPGDAG